MLLDWRALLLLIAYCGPSVEAAASELCAKVADYGHLPLAKASLSATNLMIGKTYFSLSDSGGTACVKGISEGLYAVEVSLQGFLKVRYYPVRVRNLSRTNLSFTLPFGEITEGGLNEEAILSGALKLDGSAMGNAKVCILGVDSTPVACTITNEMGEYALSIRPGMYKTEISTKDGKVYSSSFRADVPGLYTNLITLNSGEAPK